MKIAVHKSTTKTAVRVHGRRSGATKLAVRAWLRTGGALKQFYSQIGVALDRTDLTGRFNSAGTVTVTTNSATATPSGTVGTVAYLWTRTAPDAHAWTINSPTSATTTFSTSCAPDTEYAATFICTVTDGAGQVLASGTVTADCSNPYFGGGGGPYP